MKATSSRDQVCSLPSPLALLMTRGSRACACWAELAQIDMRGPDVQLICPHQRVVDDRRCPFFVRGPVVRHPRSSAGCCEFDCVYSQAAAAMCTPVERESLKALATQREALESEMASILELLNAPGQPGVRGALVDREGFPRADIDVHAVRTNRHRLAGAPRCAVHSLVVCLLTRWRSADHRL